MNTKDLIIWFGLLLFSLTACRHDAVNTQHHNVDTAKYNPTAYYMDTLRPYYPIMKLNPNNPMTKEGVSLGRMLYYENAVSKDNNRSCSTCHFQSQSFSSDVINEGMHILPHVNLAWNKYFLWNGGVEGTMEDAMMFEVQDFFECNPEQLKPVHDYPYYFFKAFGSTEITTQKIAYALAQYMRTMISDRSKFDKWMMGQAALSTSEERGLNLFYSEQADCFHCHNLMLFTDLDFHNIGLDSVYEGNNKGRYLVTGAMSDMGKFKSPSLRNIALHPPYMHDGRFQTLKQVLDFYATPTKPSPWLDPIRSKPNHLQGLNLSEQDKYDIIAFLNCLTDSSYIEDVRFSNPF